MSRRRRVRLGPLGGQGSVMRRFVTDGGLILLAAVALGFSAPATADAQNLTQLYIEVLDEEGQVIPGLTADDFIVQEDDARVNIVSVDRVSPMKIALLVDNGDMVSVMGALNPLREGLERFFDTLGPEHEVSLFTVGGNVQRRVHFTTDREELKESAGSIFPYKGSGTRMLDGIRETWERRYEDDEFFPVIVLVLTDAKEWSGTYNRDEYWQLVQSLANNGVTVNVLHVAGLGGGFISYLGRHITEDTGGIYESIVVATGLVPSLETFAERLNTHHAEMSKRYRVRYEPPDPRGGQIFVEVPRGGNVRLFSGLRMQQQAAPAPQ